MADPDVSLNWKVERFCGSAEEFHHRPLPDSAQRAVWVFEVARPALVLGSTQSDVSVDTERCAAAGVEVVRRRSGGGAVYLAPGEVTWIDVIVPTGDPLWSDDIGRSMWWLGDVWAAALGDLGVAGASVHRGGLETNKWSRTICFAGLGPGEVTVDGRKLVGVSQRRTRSAARFQCALYRHWRPEVLVGLLAGDHQVPDGLPDVAVVDASSLAVAEAFIARLP
jgi:lipoate---protein ligase